MQVLVNTSYPTLQAHGAKDKHETSSRSKTVSGTPGVFVCGHLSPFVRVESSDNDEEKSNSDQGDDDGEPDLVAERF